MQWRHQRAKAQAGGSNSLAPSDANTVFRPDQDSLAALVRERSNTAASLTDIMAELTAADVASTMAGVEGQQVVYLGHPVHVADPEDRWGAGLGRTVN
jgi:hypothetical protein